MLMMTEQNRKSSSNVITRHHLPRLTSGEAEVSPAKTEEPTATICWQRRPVHTERGGLIVAWFQKKSNVVRSFLWFKCIMKHLPCWECERYGSCFEIISAIVAVVHTFIPGKPLSALPDISFFHAFFYNSHPPVIEKKDDSSNHPFDEYPKQIKDAEQ